MPGWVNEGVKTYQKRLPRHLQLEFREFPPAQRSAGVTAERAMVREGEQLLKALPDGAHLIALDERGQQWSSTDLAGQLEGWLAACPQVVFLIGGADGLAPACKQRAQSLWSLSALTLPHALVRVVLAEQIYRAWTLVQGHPYHRE
jgi:23S rRNA (pseudouridine1915-N3)-methyltransferase